MNDENDLAGGGNLFINNLLANNDPMFMRPPP